MMGFPCFCKSSLVGSILREGLYSSTMILWVWATQMWPKHNKNNGPSVSNHLSNSLIPVLHAARMHFQGEQSSHICLPCSQSNVLQLLCHRCCLQLGVEKWKHVKHNTKRIRRIHVILKQFETPSLSGACFLPCLVAHLSQYQSKRPAGSDTSMSWDAVTHLATKNKPFKRFFQRNHIGRYEYGIVKTWKHIVLFHKPRL